MGLNGTVNQSAIPFFKTIFQNPNLILHSIYRFTTVKYILHVSIYSCIMSWRHLFTQTNLFLLFLFTFLYAFLLYNGNEGAVTASAPIDDQRRGPILTIELIKTEIHLVLFNDFCYYFLSVCSTVSHCELKMRSFMLYKLKFVQHKGKSILGWQDSHCSSPKEQEESKVLIYNIYRNHWW